MGSVAVVGVNWGDEGKGRMVDYLAADADVVVRYQGGNNAGHTVVNDHGTFKLNLVPSGVFYSNVTNVLGPGMVIDLERLSQELDLLEKTGIGPLNVWISHRATICFPYHRDQDAWEEERLGCGQFGSTKRGIAPAYSDRVRKKAIQLGDLFEPKYLHEKTVGIANWANAVGVGIYGQTGSIEADYLYDWAMMYGGPILNRVVDTSELLRDRLARGERLLFEGQLGALRDVIYGIYPFTTSSCCLASFAPIGAGVPEARLDRVIGVMKAFSTCVGAGPFVTEMDPALSGELRETADEYGAATGRPRRIGHFDAVASQYGAKMQGATELALTKLDSLSGRETLQICEYYEVEGRRVPFPLTSVLDKAQPVYRSLPGWQENIGGVQSFLDLPVAARNYVLELERIVGVPIRYVSVGPERRALMVR